jgi:N-acetylglucosamine kinase-like BadF-type ATPase
MVRFAAMTVVLGVEAGGSHCHAVLVGPDGVVLGAGANRDSGNWEDVGIGAAAGALRSCVREAFAAANLGPERIAASVFALAGIDFPIDEGRLAGVPAAIGLDGEVRLVNDAFAALRAGTARAFGVVVAAGTGSVVAGRNERGETARTLGLGPTFGDTGSASEVSEAGVTAVAHAHIGRGPDTVLSGMLCDEAGAASVEDFLEGAARGRIDAACFAPLVVEAAAAGDAAAVGVLARAGEALGETAAHVIRTLGMEGSEFDLVLAGGLLRSGSDALRTALEQTVARTAPGAAPVVLDAPPVVGSGLLALEAAGSPADAAVRQRLAESAQALIVRDAG